MSTPPSDVSCDDCWAEEKEALPPRVCVPEILSRFLLGSVPYLGDDVDLGAVGDFHRSRAVGDILVNDLSGVLVDSTGVGRGVGLDADGGSNDGSSELHFVGWI